MPKHEKTSAEVGCGCLRWCVINYFQELYAALACDGFRNGKKKISSSAVFISNSLATGSKCNY